ncbi:MAG TPA: SPOR domain-containing protein [Spirochaetota bacterium]|nr:SPOR domain-containing protein [Spirochaetota bacterium]
MFPEDEDEFQERENDSKNNEPEINQSDNNSTFNYIAQQDKKKSAENFSSLKTDVSGIKPKSLKQKLNLNKIKQTLIKRKKKILGALALLLLLVGIGSGIKLIFFGDNPADKKHPYTVRVARYRDLAEALYSKNELNDAGYNAYIESKFTGTSGLWHDLQTGAFTSLEEAKNHKSVLAKSGLDSTVILNYNKYQNKLDLPPKTEKEQNSPKRKTPDMSQAVVETIGYFPVDKKYRVVSLRLQEVQKLSKFKTAYKVLFANIYRSFPSTVTLNELENISKVIAMAKYREKLYGYQLTLTICKSDVKRLEWLKKRYRKVYEGLKSYYGDVIVEKKKYKSDMGEITGAFFISGKKAKKKRVEFIGVYRDNPYLVFVKADDVPVKAAEKLIEQDADGKGLLYYPEVRNTLLSLPARNNNLNEKEFLGFKLERVGYSYVREKDNAKWAKRMVGYWEAIAYMERNSKLWSMSLFNLESKSSSKDVYHLFSLPKAKSVDNKYMKYYLRLKGIEIKRTQVRGNRGWFLNNMRVDGTMEISFKYGQYIIAIDSFFTGYNFLDEKALKKIANELQI